VCAGTAATISRLGVFIPFFHSLAATGSSGLPGKLSGRPYVASLRPFFCFLLDEADLSFLLCCRLLPSLQFCGCVMAVLPPLVTKGGIAWIVSGRAS
jgi:hypothetical protein